MDSGAAKTLGKLLLANTCTRSGTRCADEALHRAGDVADVRLEPVKPGEVALSTREEGHAVKKILAVQEVRTSLLKSNPPQLIVSESGLVSSPEWTDARPVSYTHLTLPTNREV